MKVNVIMNNCVIGGQYDIVMASIPRIGEELCLDCFLHGKNKKAFREICDELSDEAGFKGGGRYSLTINKVRYLRNMTNGDYVELWARWEYGDSKNVNK